MHSKEDVRVCSYLLLMELYRIIGKQPILDQLQTPQAGFPGFKKQQLDHLQKGFD